MQLILCFFALIVLFFALVFCVALRKGHVSAGLRLPFASVFVETSDSNHPDRPLALAENSRFDGGAS